MAVEASKRPVRVTLTGCEGSQIRECAEAAGLEVVLPDQNPDIALTYGGDGSLLGADRDWPNLPKAVIRRDSEFKKCKRHSNLAVLTRIAEGSAEVTRLPRLNAEVRGHQFQALNDIVFHNAIPASAVRYRTLIDGDPYSGEIVGDGLIVATPFGSAAYFRSITHAVFRVGIGLAFNNSTESVNHLILSENSVIDIEIIRGPGVVFGDNMPEPITVDRGDHICIRKAEGVAEILELGTLTCCDCRHRQTGKPAGFRHV